MDGAGDHHGNFSSSSKRGSPITPRREPAASSLYSSIGNSLHGLKLVNNNSSFNNNGTIRTINSSNRNITHFDGAHETRLMSFEINWTIQHYAFMKNWKQAITSPSIMIADSADTDDGLSSWKIIFEPCKRSRHPERDQEEEWIALHVRRDEVLGKMRKNNEPSFVFARFLLTLTGPDGIEIQRRDTSEAVCFGPTENAQAARSSRQWGWERYVRQDSALKSVSSNQSTGAVGGSADNEHVKIYCELHVAIPSAATGVWKPKHTLNLPEPQFFSNLNTMRETGQLCDVTLISSDGQSFPVHRCIMAAVAEPLSVMLGGVDFKERHEKEVTFPTTPSSMLKYMIQYAYTGEQVDFIKASSSAAHDSMALLDLHTVRDLLKSADQHGMLRLKAACEARLCEPYVLLMPSTTNGGSHAAAAVGVVGGVVGGLHGGGGGVACDSDELIRELEFADIYSTETYRTCLCQYAARQPALAAASIWYFSHQRQNFVINNSNCGGLGSIGGGGGNTPTHGHTISGSSSTSSSSGSGLNPSG